MDSTGSRFLGGFWRMAFLAAGVVGCLFLAGQASPARAQTQISPDEIAANPSGAYNYILLMLSQQRYSEGLDVADAVFRYWGGRGKEQFGPGFGHFYYLQGLLYMGMERYPEAMEAFRTCRDDYPNELINEENKAERTKLANRFRTHALAQWGACLMVLGDYPQAVEKLEGALAEASGVRIRTDVIGINLGRCYLRNAQLDKGKELLQKALDSESLALELKRKAFMILAEDWSREVPFSEVQPLIWNYGHLVQNDSRSNRWARNPLFAYLGRNALTRMEPLRALTWYSFLLNPQELVEHRQATLAQYEKIRPADQKEAENLETLKTKVREEIGEAEEMVAAMLLGVGSGHYQMRNFSGAFAAFKEVSDAHPGYPKRPDALYNTVASAVQIALWREAREYGRVFLDEFPKHPLVSEVARLMVESMFMLEEWQEAYTTAVEVRDRFEVGSVARDVPDFVVGASAYHLGRLEEAESELEAYLKNYDPPRREEPATYYHGSTKVELFKWQPGVEILEAFMEKWPSSDLYSSALYQAALCRYVLQDYDDALAKLDELHEEHSDAMEIPASWNLKGDVLVAAGGVPVEDKEAAYLKGRDLAAGIPVHFETAAYSYWKLVLLRAENFDHELAVGYYDEYKQTYAGSSHELEVIAAALHSLVEVGRLQEAEETVRKQILANANDATSGRLSELMGSYLGFLDSHYSPDDALARIRTFPIPKPPPGPLKAWLIGAEIEKLEDRGELANPELIELLYQRLAREVPSEEVPSYPLIKLAKWHLSRGEDSEAKAIYETIIEDRGEGSHVEMAKFDLAELLDDSELQEDQTRAVSLYRSVREDYEIPDLQESASLGAARLLTRQERYQEAEVWWRDYLSHGNWLASRPEANLNFGRCLEESGSPNEALKIYASVYALFPGHLDWSTQAYLRAAKILKKEKRDGDALLVLVDMLKRLGHLQHQGIDEGRQLFTQWKKEWIENQ